MRNKILLSLLLAIFTLTGFGCKGLSSEEQQAIKPSTLVIWTVYDDIDALNNLAIEYKKIRPYVSVRIRQLRYDELEERFLEALADDVAPDIVSLPVEEIAKYSKRLNPMPESIQVAEVYEKGDIKTETVVNQVVEYLPTKRQIADEFVATVIDDVEINGNVYGLPLSMDTLALYYNRDLLDRSGVAEAPGTWLEFSDAVRATTRVNTSEELIQSGVALGTASNISHAPDILAMLLMQNKLDVAHGGTVDLAKGSSRLNNDHPTIQALRFYTDFADKERQVYTWNEEQEEALESFVRGKSVFYFGFARDLETIERQARNFDIEILPVPQLAPSSPANIANYWTLTVPEKSPYKSLAWDFIRFATTERSIRNYVSQTKFPSPLRSHVKLFAADEDLAPFMTQMLFAKTWYSGNNKAVASQALADLIENYRQPYTEKEKPLERDAKLLNYTARLIRQTF